MTSRSTAFLIVLVATLSGYLGYKAFSSLQGSIPNSRGEAAGVGVGSIIPTAHDSVTSQFLVVVLGATWCVGANDKRLREAIGGVQSFRARTSRQNLALVGIAIDRNPKQGMAWLNRLGDFDELLTGSHWLNTGMIHFVWSGGLTRPALPQLMVMARKVNLSKGALGVSGERLIESAVGVRAIQDLVERLPSLITGWEKRHGDSVTAPAQQ